MRVLRSGVLVGLAVVLAVLVSPALAKVMINEVSVEAEDGTVLTLTGLSAPQDLAVQRLAVASHLTSAIFRTDPRILMSGPPSGELGPRFLLVWDLGFGEPIRQDVYPFTDDGPVSYVAADQPLAGDPTSPANRTYGGWFLADVGLAAVLADLGFTLPDPVPVAAGIGGGEEVVSTAAIVREIPVEETKASVPSIKTPTATGVHAATEGGFGVPTVQLGAFVVLLMAGVAMGVWKRAQIRRRR